MTPSHPFTRTFAAMLAAGLLALLLVPLAVRSSHAAANVYYVGPGGSDTNAGQSADAPFKSIQKAIDLAQAGETIVLAPGVYLQDIVSRRAGTADAPISLRGPVDAVLKGGGNARIFEINHDNITIEGFTIDGLWGSADSASGYRDKLLFVLGKAPRDGVSGLRVLNMTFRNAGGECLRLRYFAQRNEIAGSTFANCGVNDFRFGGGGKNGEAVYIGTAPEQRGDGKNPTADPDLSNANWVHHNTFDTQGNECVDIKEAATANIVEHNRCTGQRDPDSGGFDSRGSGNIFRYNESYGNAGAGIRIGGDTATDGISNDVYGNTIRDNRAGGIKFQRTPQGAVCDNTMANNTGGNAVGTYGTQFKPASPCGTSAPTPSATPAPTTTATPPPASTATKTPAGTATPAPTSPALPGSCRTYMIDGRAKSFIEAEQYSSSGGRFVRQTASDRSAGTYMRIPGSGTSNDPKTYLAFDLQVREGGTFYVWLLGYGPDDSTDSFFVQVDSDSSVQSHLARGKWSWKRASSTIKISNGAHTLKIKNREDGASVDKILLIRDKGYTPSGLGDTALALQCR